jgi:hypothetical protein
MLIFEVGSRIDVEIRMINDGSHIANSVAHE